MKPESDTSHTQLAKGKSKSGKGTYVKAREFGYNGKPIKDIHFTDHGLPDLHDCPHEHLWLENSTGGSMRLGPPQRLKYWDYR